MKQTCIPVLDQDDPLHGVAFTEDAHLPDLDFIRAEAFESLRRQAREDYRKARRSCQGKKGLNESILNIILRTSY